jgi:hypothetical protein
MRAVAPPSNSTVAPAGKQLLSLLGVASVAFATGGTGVVDTLARVRADAAVTGTVVVVAFVWSSCPSGEWAEWSWPAWSSALSTVGAGWPSGEPVEWSWPEWSWPAPPVPSAGADGVLLSGEPAEWSWPEWSWPAPSVPSAGADGVLLSGEPVE